MTSQYATNYRGDDDRPKSYLQRNEFGQPLQGQIGRTLQVYSGTGNATINFDGSNDLYINSTASAGVLTIAVATPAALANLIGREISIVGNSAPANNIVVTIAGSGAAYRSSVSAYTGTIATVSSGAAGYAITLRFLSPTTVSITGNTFVIS